MEDPKVPVGPPIPGIPTSSPAPPDERHEVKPLIDGNNVFGSLYSDLNEAREFIYLAYWQIEKDFLIDQATTTTLVSFCARALLAHPNLEIYFLIWNILPTISKSDFGLPPAAEARLHIELDANLPAGSHHQKFVLMDVHPESASQPRDASLHCMGLNLSNTYWDRIGHPVPRFASAPKSWHDTSVRVQGPTVRDFENEFVRRWVAAGGGTLPTGRFNNGVRGTTQASSLIKPARQRPNPLSNWYQNGLAFIQKFFYFETQYFMDDATMKMIISRFLQNEQAGTPIRGAIVQTHLLDLGPIEALLGSVRIETFKQLRRIRASTTKRFWVRGQAAPIVRPVGGWKGVYDRYDIFGNLKASVSLVDATGKRFLWRNVTKTEGGIDVYRLVANDPQHSFAYVHSKMGIIDGEYTIGSCNISERSFKLDSEANVLVQGAGETSDLIRTYWPNILKNGANPTNIDEWLDAFRSTADANDARARAGQLPDGRVHHFPLNTFTQ